MKKILILYGFEHSGHHAAALALREAFLQKDPGITVDLLNFFVYSSRLIEKIATGIFYRIVKRTPSVWDGIYRNPKSEPRFDRFRKVVRTLSLRGVGDALREYEPDAVVCTQSFPCGMMHDYKDRRRSDIPLYGVLTDFSVPPYWIYPRVDRYFVACAAARDELSLRGIDAAAITESGIPIRPRFALRTSRREARAAFGLDPDAATILVVGGWSGWGDLERLAVETGRRGGECRVVVVTGRNRRLYDTLRGRADIEHHRVTVLPVVERMDILMRAADLLVGKAGGMTASEALAAGLPMVLVDSLPGQERANAAYLCRHGAAVQARGVEDAGRTAAEIARDAGRLGEMGRRARALAKPDAATEVARGVIEGTYAIPLADRECLKQVSSLRKQGSSLDAYRSGFRLSPE
jgi:processive 1,2-diacylglycerol beta-glucosyltransferase